MALRQECPLSPYLVILCSEILSLELQRRQMEASLYRYRPSPLVYPITHLLFADDCLLSWDKTKAQRGALMPRLSSLMDKCQE